MRLGLLTPVVRWVASFGNNRLDYCWLIVDIWLVSWLIVALVSIIGGLFIKRHLLLNVLLFGISFAFVPLALHAYLYSRVPKLLDYEQHIIIVGVAVVCGLLSNKFRLRHANRVASYEGSSVKH